MNFFKKIFYGLFCKTYRFIIKIFYKIKFKKSNIKNLNYKCLKYSKHKDLKSFLQLENKKLIKSDYQEIFIFEKKELKKLIDFIFDNDFKKFLFKISNCCFSVDFISIYKNKYLNKKERMKSLYANLLHIDKPFSRFTLKLFIPVNVINEKFGALEVKNIKPENLLRKYNSKEYFKLFAEENKTNIFLFNPSQNFHRANSPHKNKESQNIIIQLNPSKNWSYCSLLYKKQFMIEPNFPEIRNFNIKKILF